MDIWTGGYIVHRLGLYQCISKTGGKWLQKVNGKDFLRLPDKFDDNQSTEQC